MKLFIRKKTGPANTATYEKRCECCGRKFKATYSASDYYAYQTAKDMVNSNYNAHKLFCKDVPVTLNISA